MVMRLVLVCSAALQLTTAAMAFRLIRLTGHQTIGLLVTSALALMAIRRILPLYTLLSGDASFAFDLVQEIIGLVLSFLLLIAILRMTPYFVRLQQSEGALRESEERFRFLFESAGVGIGYYSPEGVVLSYNALAAGYMNGKPEDFVGKSLYEIFPKAEADLYFQRIRASLDSDLPQDYVDQVNLPAGKSFFHSTFTRDLDAKKSVIGVQIVSTDITALKQTELENAIVARVGKAVGSSLSLQDVYECIAAQSLQAIPYDRFMVTLKNEGKNTLTVDYVAGIENPARTVKTSYPVAGSSAGEVITTRSAILIQPDDPEEIRHRYPNLYTSYQNGLRSTLTVPLLHQDEVIGALVFRSGQPRAYSQEQLCLAERIGQQVAGAVVNARLFDECRRASDRVSHSEQTYRTLVEGLPDVVMRFDCEGRHLFVSKNVSGVVHLDAAQFLGKTHRELGFPESLCRFWETSIQDVFDKGEPVETEFSFEGKEGPLIHNWRLLPERDSQGIVRSVLSLSRDITAYRHTEESYRSLFREMLNGFALHEIICDQQGNPIDYRFIAVNPAFERMTGLKAEEIIGRTVLDVLPGLERWWIERYGKVALTGETSFFESYARVLNKYFDVTAYRPSPNQFASLFHDITDRKQANQERENLIKLLALLNSENNLKDLIKIICEYLLDWSGCEAVGIRLRQGDDFPYYETSGFPSHFVQAENHLCVTDLDGQIAKNGEGNPVLECMCGNVLSGRFNPSKPFFTRHGSFWTNSTSALLASTCEADRQARTRNRCHGEGYESVALIPLRMGKESFGLIQINDKRTNRFTEAFIEQIERMGDNIGISLSQRRSQKELHEKEQQLSKIAGMSPVGIVQLNHKGEIVFANPLAERILGLDKASLTDRTYNSPDWKITDLAGNAFPPDELPFNRVMETGKAVYDVQHAIESQESGRIKLSINAAPLFNETGRFDGMVACISDITEQKQKEEERRILEERLQRAEKMEALGQLAGGVAHDLNNVLSVTSIYSELLQENLPEGSPLRKAAESILASTQKAADIIQDLLTLSRRGVVTAEVVNINRIVNDFILTPVFERIRGDHFQVVFRIECDGELQNIKGSPVHLEKALMNLVLNATEAITGKGEVTIRTENRYLDRPVRGYDEVQEGDYVVLMVTDTGMGIPGENIGKIFEPFYTKKSMGRSGTGLGLAIVWGAVKDHRGYIDVQSEAGKGTTFMLYFPVTREMIGKEEDMISVEQYMGHGETILVVDDMAEQRQVAEVMLRRLGYEVHTAASGEEALEYLRSHKTDLLVLDMIMESGMDGLETYKRISAMNPGQRAIIVSGYAETERVKEAQHLGAGTYVRKPYLREKIGIAIRDELRKQ